jgi:hypothetical protein
MYNNCNISYQDTSVAAMFSLECASVTAISSIAKFSFWHMPSSKPCNVTCGNDCHTESLSGSGPKTHFWLCSGLVLKAFDVNISMPNCRASFCAASRLLVGVVLFSMIVFNFFFFRAILLSVRYIKLQVSSVDMFTTLVKHTGHDFMVKAHLVAAGASA